MLDHNRELKLFLKAEDIYNHLNSDDKKEYKHIKIIDAEIYDNEVYITCILSKETLDAKRSDICYQISLHPNELKLVNYPT